MKYLLLSLLAFSQFAFAESNDPLAKVVEHFRVEWRDGNISTGTTDIMLTEAATLNKKSMEKSLTALLKEEIDGRTDGAGKLSKLVVKNGDFKPVDVMALAQAYQMGNAFADDKESLKYGMASVYAILRNLSLDKNNDIQTTTVSGVYKQNGEKRKIVITALTNIDNKLQVLFLIVEGTM